MKFPLASCSIADFFATANERERVRIRRETGQRPPWSTDPVFNTVRLCNLHREDDKVTRWFKENIRDPLDLPDFEHRAALILATVVFRWFNHIPTGEVLKPVLVEGPWNRTLAEMVLRLRYDTQLLGGAYLIKSPAGVDKITGLLNCIEPVARYRWALAHSIMCDGTLQHAHEELMNFPYLGPFMAYQSVCDLRHTLVLRDASDKMTWTCLGPGSARGLQWVTGQRFGYNSAKDQARGIEVMRWILEQAPKGWEMATVQHWLCEFDKIMRARTGQHVKRGFNACSAS